MDCSYIKRGVHKGEVKFAFKALGKDFFLCEIHLEEHKREEKRAKKDIKKALSILN